MLWKPITDGEHAFLRIYEVLSRHINVTSEELGSMDFLFAEHAFQEFIRLNATLEVFLRSLRSAIFAFTQLQHLGPVEFVKRLAKDEFVTSTLARDRIFCEMLKSAAETSLRETPAPNAVKAAVLESSPFCYICGVTFEKKHARNAVTLDHVWPLSLGGASKEENLMPACRDCNTKRGNRVTWAWGPVQSTDYRHDAKRNPEFDLRFSLATSRLMFEAAGRNGKGPRRTLKDSAIRLRPLFSDLGVKDARHRVYFELLGNVRELA